MGSLRSSISGKLVVQLLIVVVLIPLLPLLISWRWNWWEAWVFAVVYILGFVLSRVWASRRNPDLLVERARSTLHANTKAWDKYLAPMVALGSALIPLAAGLEARFGNQTVFGPMVKTLAVIALLSGYVLASYALAENRFFSGVVRIQSERGHHVIATGPYRWVRHPGYLGTLLNFVAVPFLLDSVWALVAALLLMLVLVVRTSLEDSTLQKELTGYRAYAQRVRHRLLPGVW